MARSFFFIAAALSTMGCAAEVSVSPKPVPPKPEPVVTTAAVLPAPAEPATPAAPPLASIIKEATATDTPILLYFTAIWCQPCATLEAEVLPQPSVQAGLAAWRYQKYDAEIGEGLAAAKQLNVAAYPTLVFLSPKGEEIGRDIAPTNAALYLKLVSGRLESAKGGIALDGDLATITDATKLLNAARVEETRKDGSMDRARKIYALAAVAAKKAKKLDVASEADFSLLRLDSQQKDRKAHVSALMGFAAKHADSPRAVDALEGVAALSADAPPRSKELKRVGGKVLNNLVAAKNTVALRKLGTALRKLGDEDGAKRAEEASGPMPSGGPMLTMPPRDPLGPKAASPFDLPPEAVAKMQVQTALARQISEGCRSLPHVDAHVIVRVYASNHAVTKAVVLDPEVSPELKACLEKGAMGLKDFPNDLGERTTFNVPLVAKPMEKKP
jgi:hypothetical protein